MRKTPFGLIAIAVFAAVGIYVLINLSGSRNGPAQTPDPNETLVKNLTINFSAQMQKVSLSAPTTTLVNEIKDMYSNFVSPELIATWTEHPSQAPGRLTSSPWPDHILIDSVSQVSPGDYTVQGQVIEVTSTGFADKYPVTLVVTQVNGQWTIVSYQDGLDRPKTK